MLATRFGWTPDQVNNLTLDQIARLVVPDERADAFGPPTINGFLRHLVN